MSTEKTGGLFDTTDAVVPGNPGRAMTAHIDGGARGNPGPAGYGAFITDENGNKLAELSDYLGVQTNNFAEYSGLVAALEYAIAHGYRVVKVVSDSELLVKQIKGQYKVRSESLLAIYQEARGLIHRLDRFEIRHVLRHLNKDADRLANLAMDRGMKSKSAPRADAYAKAPAPPAKPSDDPRELRGLVRNGVVEFRGEKFPEGAAVIVRRER